MPPAGESTHDALERHAPHWRVFANAATVSVLTSLVKLAGAVKVAVTARFFGAGDALDAFLIAFVLPSFFADLVAGCFTPSLIPAFIRAQAASRRAANDLAGSSLAAAVAALTAVAVMLALTGPWLLPLLGSSFSLSKLELTTRFFLGLLLWLPLGAAIAVWRAVLNANRKFALAAIAPLATPLIIIALLFRGGAYSAPHWSANVLVAGTLAGIAVESAILALAVRSQGYSLLPRWRGWTPELDAIRRQYVPLLGATAVTSACVLVDQAVAGTLGPGSVSALAFGTRLAAVMLAVCTAGVATALLPEFSRLAANQQWSRLRRATVFDAGLITLVSLPAAILLAALSAPIARLAFEGGAFDPSTTRLVSDIQRYSVLQIPFAVLFVMAGRLASALSANALLARTGAVALVCCIAADFTLARFLGVRGIALSSVLVQAVSLIVLTALLWRREPRLFSAARGAA